MRRKCLLVLSSPRCGSSCTTACIHLCGVTIGTHLTTVKDHLNAKGYFENYDILRYNERMLSHIRLAWHRPTKVEGDKTQQLLDAGQKELCEIFRNQYGKKEIFLIKDPRIATLWPVYISVFDHFNIQPMIVKLIRNRDDSCKSMMRMTRMGLPKVQSVYDGYYELINELADEYPSHTLSFESLLLDPTGETKKVCEFAGIDFSEKHATDIEEFVSHDLVNFKTKRQKLL